MTTFTEALHPFEFLHSQANGSRSLENITLMDGQNRQAGDVLGLVATGAATSAAKAGGNTGNGTFTIDGTTPLRTDYNPDSRKLRAIDNATAVVKNLQTALSGLKDKTITVTTRNTIIAATAATAGKRAAGGPVKAGKLYEVGETGRELFAPDQDGEIINASDTRRLLEGNTGARAMAAATLGVVALPQFGAAPAAGPSAALRPNKVFSLHTAAGCASVGTAGGAWRP